MTNPSAGAPLPPMTNPSAAAPPSAKSKSIALRFVLMIGVVSLFADMTYEGSRSITGPYLAVLGASATAVGIIAGLGELLGYSLRLVSGRLSDKTGQYWPITIFGYVVQMLAVPAVALAGSWEVAAVLIILERVGKATRNPPRDVMLARASVEIGRGWAFGLHEALDQFGALVGPLIAAWVLYTRGDYRSAFAMLLIPALLTLTLVVVARVVYPKPEDLHSGKPPLEAKGLSRTYWIYLAGAALVAAGYADFSLVAYHFEKAGSVPRGWVPIFYSVAMGAGGLASLVFGRVFDRAGIKVLIPLTIVAAAATPLVFLGGFWASLAGIALWGVGMGVHESIMSAAVAEMVSESHLASAYGIFTTGYGVAWFLGSASLGFLYDRSIPWLIAFSVAAELLSVPFFVRIRGATRRA
jgi:MFS family permease